MVIKVDRENTVWGVTAEGAEVQSASLAGGAVAWPAPAIPRHPTLIDVHALDAGTAFRWRDGDGPQRGVVVRSSRLSLLSLVPPAPPGMSSATPRDDATIPLRVYLMRGNKLGVSGRDVPVTKAVAHAAVTLLLAGPTNADKRAGLSTDIPPGTHLLAVSIVKGTARVDLSPTFARGADPRTVTARAAQLVYTLTQFPDVSRVVVRVDGRPPKVGGDLLNFAKPLRRSKLRAGDSGHPGRVANARRERHLSFTHIRFGQRLRGCLPGGTAGPERWAPGQRSSSGHLGHRDPRGFWRDGTFYSSGRYTGPSSPSKCRRGTARTKTSCVYRWSLAAPSATGPSKRGLTCEARSLTPMRVRLPQLGVRESMWRWNCWLCRSTTRAN